MSILFRQSLILGLCVVSSSWTLAAVKEYHLTIAEATVNLTGKPVKRITVNGQFPAPLFVMDGVRHQAHLNSDSSRREYRE